MTAHGVIHSFLDAASPLVLRQLLVATVLIVAALLFAVLSRRTVRAAARSSVLFGAMALSVLPLALLSRHVAAAIQGLIEIFARTADPVPLRPAAVDVAVDVPSGSVDSEIACIAVVVWIAGLLLSLLLMVGRSIRAQVSLRGGERHVRSEQVVRRAVGPAVNRLPSVVVNDRVTTPALVGIWRVRVVLPRSVCDMADEELESLLLHELAHFRRRDNLADVARLLFSAAFWFHPAAWALNASYRRVREEACDQFVVETTGDVAGYINAVTMLARPAMPAAVHGLSCFGSSDLSSRMRNLVHYNKRRSSMMKTRNVAAVLVAVALTALGGASYAAEAAAPDRAQEPSTSGPYTMTVKVTSPGPGQFTAAIEVSEVATGVVVSAPRVTTQAGQPAEVTSEDPSGMRFSTKIDIDAKGKGTFVLNVTKNGEQVQNLVVVSRVVEESTGTNGTPPQVLTHVDAPYTPEAAAARAAGMVLIRVHVDERGSVTRTDLLKGLPFGLDQSAIDAVRKWTFSPALGPNGNAEKGTLRVMINFDPNEPSPAGRHSPKS